MTKTIDWNELNCRICCTACDGVDAHNKLIEYAPDIIITDIMMPGFTGLNLAEMMQDRLSHSKFIIITGYNCTEYARKSIKLKVFDYIPKPLDNLEVIKVVKEAIKSLEGKDGEGVKLEKQTDPVEQLLLRTESKIPNCSALVQNVASYIQKNIFSELSLKTVSNEFFITPGYLSNLIKKELGVSFVQYVTIKKLKEAQILLANPRNKVYEVANILGYKEYSYFYQVYKKYYGHAPGKAN